MARHQAGERQDWAGGYRRFDGTAWTYYIKRRDPRLGRGPDGRANRREVCTGAHSDEVAQVHLEAFEKNPLAYDPSKVLVGRAPLPFTDALCIEYLNYLITPQSKGGKGDSPGHCHSSRYALKWWREELGETNLRALTVDELRVLIPVNDVLDERGNVLRGCPAGRKIKIAAIKHFISWLRKVRGDGLSQGEGPDMTFLSVPQHKGRKLHDPKLALERRDKGKRALEGYPLLRAELSKKKQWHWAMDALDLQADTGWHTTEVERWVSLGGLFGPMPAGREDEAAGVLITVQKSGDEVRTPVSREGAEAARRLYEYCSARLGETHVGWDPSSKTTKEFAAKPFPRQQYERLCVRLCKVHGIPHFGPGHMRHAVATMNSGSGIAAPIIGAFLSHSEQQRGELVRTTYADADSQLRVVQSQVRPVPARIPSPLQRLKQAEATTTTVVRSRKHKQGAA